MLADATVEVAWDSQRGSQSSLGSDHDPVKEKNSLDQVGSWILINFPMPADLILMGQYYPTSDLTMVIVEVRVRMTLNNVTVDNSLYEICLYSMMIGWPFRTQ